MGENPSAHTGDSTNPANPGGDFPGTEAPLPPKISIEDNNQKDGIFDISKILGKLH